MSEIQFILSGVWTTLEYAVVSFIFGLILGLILALIKISGQKSSRWKPLAYLADAYTSVFRGTPVLVQLSVVYFGIPHLFDYQISPLLAGIITFSLNSGAYISEIIRAGIRAIDAGQFEAAQTLQIPYFYTMRDIILPQAFRNVLPSLGNEATTLIKETALISTLGESDLMRRAQLVAAEKYTYFLPLFTAAVCYFGLVLIFNFIFKKLEKKFSV